MIEATASSGEANPKSAKGSASKEPFSAKHGKTAAAWSIVARAFGQTIADGEDQGAPDGLACQRRFNNLIDAFKSQTLASLQASLK
ncbi:hypothetical protein DFJ73DRAFT_779839 [Zopfochytrium polystomum]|nr:hypothetical protein DFJ73DRAFT_779839 [Zopfochytrium polystomum]